MEASDSFSTIGDAFVWYMSEGGQRQKTSFYAAVPRSNGSKRISRLAVSEMLRKERTPKSGDGNYSDRKEKADVEKAEAEAEMKQRQNERERRELDAGWMLREDAYKLIGLWVDFAFNACSDRVKKALPAIIQSCGGDQNRLTELRDVVEQTFDEAGNDLANAGEITAVFVEDDA